MCILPPAFKRCDFSMARDRWTNALSFVLTGLAMEERRSSSKRIFVRLGLGLGWES